MKQKQCPVCKKLVLEKSMARHIGESAKNECWRLVRNAMIEGDALDIVFDHCNDIAHAIYYTKNMKKVYTLDI